MRYSRTFLFLFVFAFSLVAAIRPAFAADQWLQVRSKNFFLVGNASEKEIRKVATRLEQFRETFRQIFRGMNLVSPIPTNVVVFKGESAFKPFKPKRADGKADTRIIGYFQAGEDVNYITLSTEGSDERMFETIFHEYVHSIIEINFGKSNIPAWFNEGLAQYYETFRIEEDQKVKLGLLQAEAIMLLQRSEFIPLDRLFRMSNRQLHGTGGFTRDIFYAQSWALVHFLLQGGKTDSLAKFLDALIRDVAPAKAFYDSFGTSYEQTESDLRKYISNSRYNYVQITFKMPLRFDAEMQVAPLDEAESNAYLGDLLYHTNRADDAEPYLTTALKLKPEMSMAITALGMVKIRQRKWSEAKTYLEKAIADDQRNHLAFYQYAYLLSREGRDEFGFLREYDKETAAKIRAALKKAIAIKPDFTESYELHAFVDMVNNEGLDEAVVLMQRALKYQPGNQRYALRIAELYFRQDKLKEAASIADKIAETTDDDQVRERAESLGSRIRERQEFAEKRAGLEKAVREAPAGAGSGSGSGGAPVLRRRGEQTAGSTETVRSIEEANIISMNGALRAAEPGESRVVGNISKIECKGANVTYTVTAADGTFHLTSKDFEALYVNTFVSSGGELRVGCDEDLSNMRAVITYKARPQANLRGDLVAIEIVPPYFRLMTEKELAAVPTLEKDDTLPPPPPTSQQITSGQPLTSTEEKPDLETIRRNLMMEGIRRSLRIPVEGEKREMAVLETIECTKKAVFYRMRTATATLRLTTTLGSELPIRIYTRDLDGFQMGCGMKPVEVPAVIVYRDKADPKTKASGEIVSIEFVPKSFILN